MINDALELDVVILNYFYKNDLKSYINDTYNIIKSENPLVRKNT